jgi:terminase large subunit-like protein
MRHRATILREVMEQVLREGEIAHGNHPVLAMCFMNATVVTDDAGNRKLSKEKSSGRIDAAVALAMAVGVAPLKEKTIDLESLIGARRTTPMDQTIRAILAAADEDPTALVDALVRVVEARHYNQQGAQDEMEAVTAYPRSAVSNDAAKARWSKAAAGVGGGAENHVTER